MASLSIRCGGNNLNLRGSSYVNHSNQNARFCSLTISNHSRKNRGISMAATATATAAAVAKSRLRLEPSGKSERIENESIGYEKIDEWMRESVNEIVQNLRQAPLLLQVFSENNGTSTTTKVKTERAVVDDWPVIKSKWEDGETPLPEGVILVEELKEDDDESEVEEEKDDEERGISRAWGIVIQGKGVELGPACYLLKTSRVRSSLGLCCTHFCLVRVNSFRESAESQLTNCWLLQ